MLLLWLLLRRLLGLGGKGTAQSVVVGGVRVANGRRLADASRSSDGVLRGRRRVGLRLRLRRLRQHGVRMRRLMGRRADGLVTEPIGRGGIVGRMSVRVHGR